MKVKSGHWLTHPSMTRRLSVLWPACRIFIKSCQKDADYLGRSSPDKDEAWFMTNQNPVERACSLWPLAQASHFKLMTANFWMGYWTLFDSMFLKVIESNEYSCSQSGNKRFHKHCPAATHNLRTKRALFKHSHLV